MALMHLVLEMRIHVLLGCANAVQVMLAQLPQTLALPEPVNVGDQLHAQLDKRVQMAFAPAPIRVQAQPIHVMVVPVNAAHQIHALEELTPVLLRHVNVEVRRNVQLEQLAYQEPA